MSSVQEQRQPETGYKTHPAATLFPMMDERELFNLAEDISKNGLLEPVILYHGEILDGRNRLEACKIASVEPRFEQVNGEIGSPTIYVLSKNLHRRHLTTSQRGAIAAEVVDLLKEESHQRQISQLKHQESSLTPIGVNEGRSNKIAAEQLHVGERTVCRAVQVKRESPEAFERVKAGEITLNAATGEQELRTQKARQQRESEPYSPKTDHAVKLANGQKERMISCLSNITGICRGLKELKMPMALSVCSAEERQGWIDRAKELSGQLRQFAKKLEETTWQPQQS